MSNRPSRILTNVSRSKHSVFVSFLLISTVDFQLPHPMRLLCYLLRTCLHAGAATTPAQRVVSAVPRLSPVSIPESSNRRLLATFFFQLLGAGARTGQLYVSRTAYAQILQPLPSQAGRSPPKPSYNMAYEMDYGNWHTRGLHQNRVSRFRARVWPYMHGFPGVLSVFFFVISPTLSASTYHHDTLRRGYTQQS
jgi:hypothetical protein